MINDEKNVINTRITMDCRKNYFTNIEQTVFYLIFDFFLLYFDKFSS